MKVGNELHFLTIPYADRSLHSLIADGVFRRTNIKRSTWKSLLTNASLQRQCNKQGFNNDHQDKEFPSVRIGILGNQEMDCATPDSYIGIGAKHDRSFPVCRIEGTTAPTSGNYAICEADNGTRNIKSMGYILVR